MKVTAMFALVIALVAVSNAADQSPIYWPAVKSRVFPTALDHLKVSKLLVLDPSATRSEVPSSAARFHKWVVAASSVQVDVSSKSPLILSMRAIVGSSKDGVAACFDPHHGATLTDGVSTFDVVICFECARYEVFDAEGRLIWGGSFAIAESEAPKWNHIFRTAGLEVRD
jgi:hypothetical protein